MYNIAQKMGFEVIIDRFKDASTSGGLWMVMKKLHLITDVVNIDFLIRGICMEKGEQRVNRLNVYLMKDSVKDFRECIKADYEKNVEIYDFKESAGVKGIILVANDYANEPEWKIFLDEFSS